MKNKILITIFLISGIWFTACQKQDEPTPAPPPIVQPPPPEPEPVTGTMMFYIDTASQTTDHFYYGFKLYIGNQYIGGSNTQFISYEPDCGNPYGVHYGDTAKSYNFRIITLDESHEWNSSFTITADGCDKIALRDQ